MNNYNTQYSNTGSLNNNNNNNNNVNVNVNNGMVEDETGGITEGSKHPEQLAARRVLFMGLPRSGKSSILSVIFENALAYDTIGMPPTQERVAYQMAVTGITAYDFPGIDEYSETQYSSAVDPAVYAGDMTSLVYVVDSQGDFQNSLATLFSIIRNAQAVNPRIPINIFLNKIDGLSEELKDDIQQDIQQKVFKTMGYENMDYTFVRFFLTTIFTESVREAMSNVVRQLVPKHATLETILNSFCTKSGLDKVFLFDVATKVYLSMDSSPTDSHQYMFSCQTIDAMEDLTLHCNDAIVSNEEASLLMHKIIVGLSNETKMLICHVNPFLSLLCIGQSRVFRHRSSLEFNVAKVAKAIHQILMS